MDAATLPAICRELGIPLARGERFLRQFPQEIPDSRRVGCWRLFPRAETLNAFRRLLDREARERAQGVGR